MQDDWKASFFAFFPNIWVTWFAQLQTNKFEGLFKDKLQFSTTPFDSFNPLWSTYWLKHVMESFKIFTSSAMVDLYFLLQQDFAEWLGMTCNFIWGMEIPFEIEKQKSNIVHAKKGFHVTSQFYRLLHRG